MFKSTRRNLIMHAIKLFLDSNCMCPLRLFSLGRELTNLRRISFGIIISYVFVRIELHNERNVLALYFRVSYSLKKINFRLKSIFKRQKKLLISDINSGSFVELVRVIFNLEADTYLDVIHTACKVS